MTSIVQNIEPGVGVIAAPQDTLRNTLSKAVAFQEFVGAADDTEALESIGFHALPPPAVKRAEHTLEELQGYRPYALIFTPVDGATDLRERAAPRTWARSGRMVIYFERDVPPDDDAQGQHVVDRNFENIIGRIISTCDDAQPGLAELSNQPGNIFLRSITVYGPHRTHEDARQSLGDAQSAFLQLEWGRTS